MYTLPQTSPPGPVAGFKAPDPSRHRDCPQCGAKFRPRRSDQKFCRAECRTEARRIGVLRRRQRPGSKRSCAWCGLPFEARPNQEYCGPKCRQCFNNWAKGWGPRLVKVLFAWRYRGRRVCLTDICQTVAAAWDDLRARRAAAAAERKSVTDCPPASTQSPSEPGFSRSRVPEGPRALRAALVFSSQARSVGADRAREAGGGL